MLFFFSAILGGCDFSFNKTIKNINGTVTFNNEGLQGVKLTDKVYTYATTDSNGNFSFDTIKEKLVIYPQKAGYIFTPAMIEITDQTTVNFTCEKADILNGTLKLSKINITPTSIVSFSENNFLYKYENQDCLKFDSINFVVNQTEISSGQDCYLPINIETNVLVDNNNDNSFEYEVVDGVANIKISYVMSTYFTIYNHESTAKELEKVVRVDKTLDTGNLINNQFELFASTNSSHNGFSYNISFIFDYTSNEGV